MTPEKGSARRFPIGLTIAAGLVLCLLVALGVWQLQRLKWKEALLSKIAALQHVAPRPIGPVLVGASGVSAEFTRVTATCGDPPRPGPAVFRYSLREGRIGWRLISVCPLEGAVYDGILLDRGLVQRFAGAMAPAAAVFPAPIEVTGVLRAPGAKPFLEPAASAQEGVLAVRVIDAAVIDQVARQRGLRRPAPYLLAVESEAPPPLGVQPAALPESIPNNHLVYALTWFGLAGALVGVYGAMLAGRLRGR